MIDQTVPESIGRCDTEKSVKSLIETIHDSKQQNSTDSIRTGNLPTNSIPSDENQNLAPPTALSTSLPESPTINTDHKKCIIPHRKPKESRSMWRRVHKFQRSFKNFAEL